MTNTVWSYFWNVTQIRTCHPTFSTFIVTSLNNLLQFEKKKLKSKHFK